MGLSEQQRRTIQDYIAAGVSRCTDRIEKMSHKPWGMMSSSTQEMTAVGMLSWFRREQEKHYSVKFRSVDDLPLDIFVLYSDESAKALTESVTAPYGERMKALDNLTVLTIGEVSNVIAQSVVGVMADKLESLIILSIPEVFDGSKVDLLAEALDGYDGRKDSLLLSHVELYSESLAANCSIVLILDTVKTRNKLKAQTA